MKILKRSISMLLLFMGLFAIPVSAHPAKNNLFLGEVINVQECNKNGEMRILVSGYLNGCEIYKGEISVLVDKHTKVINGCEKDDCKNIKCQKGDFVSISLDNKMTKSNPPQARAKKIKITRNENSKYDKKDDVKEKSNSEENNKCGK